MTTTDLVVRRARLEGAAGLADVAVSGGRIAAVSASLDATGTVELDAAGPGRPSSAPTSTWTRSAA